MQRHTVATVLVAASLAFAGCGGALPGGDGESGTVNMYISDQQNAISEFDHLNVTVTSVAVHRADDAATETNESGWVEQGIENVTVDLTELQGENATQVGQIPAPNGSYDKTFVHVQSNITGVLTDGSTTPVQLPSNKLHINQNFTVGDGETVDFVFDLSVHEAGGSGKYVIRPTVGESGPDQPYEEKPSAKRGGDSGEGDDASTATPASTDSSTSTSAEGQASLDFYVSDEQNAISAFAHLNVTIERVGVHRVNGSANGSAWVEQEVGNATVDLTELQGANATKLGTLPVANGTYDKTFVYVSEINGTLVEGGHPDVKLPSSKLQLNKQFTVGNGESVDFVFDITVVKRGNSGSYNVKPVVGESGTGEQVDIEETGDDEREDDEREGENETATEAAEPPALNASLLGNATAGGNVTLSVTRNGSAVANATVEANGEVVGETDANGTLVVSVPAAAEELELTVTAGEAETELEVGVAAAANATTTERRAAPPV